MESLSPKPSLKWMSESKKGRSKNTEEEQEQLTIVTLSDEILDESESHGVSVNGSSKEGPIEPLPPQTSAHGTVPKGCWVSFEVRALPCRIEPEVCYDDAAQATSPTMNPQGFRGALSGSEQS